MSSFVVQKRERHWVTHVELLTAIAASKAIVCVNAGGTYVQHTDNSVLPHDQKFTHYAVGQVASTGSTSTLKLQTRVALTSAWLELPMTSNHMPVHS